jgi:tryptophan synthase alpha chain
LTALIVPDLPFDSPLAAPVWADDKVSLFPVIGHNIAPDRLRDLCRRAPTFVYVMSGYKLTGSAFGLAEELPQLIEALRGDAGASVGIGFGIATPEDATAVLKVADCAIIGSAFLRAANEDRLVSLLDDFRAELTPQFTPPA